MLSSSPSIGPLLVYQLGYEQARRDPTPPLSSWLPWAARREVCAAQEAKRRISEALSES
jgi:hypothetical protein